MAGVLIHPPPETEPTAPEAPARSIRPRNVVDKTDIDATGVRIGVMPTGTPASTLSGASRFRVLREVEGFPPYRRCEVSWDGFERDRGPVERDPGLDRTSFLDALNRFFESQGLSTDWDTVREAEDELLINSISMLCPFPPEDKQALLEAPTLPTRRETLVTLIEFDLRGGSGGPEMLQ